MPGVHRSSNQERLTSRRLPDISILAGLCLVLYLPFLFTGRTPLPVDWLGILPSGPYNYSAPKQPHAYSMDPTGSLGGDIGWTAYTAESLKHGTIPFWNPYQSLGEPYLAEGGNQILYPLNWLNMIVPVKYWDILRFLHLFLGSWFVYLFAKECGLSRWPALVAGTCFYAQGFFQGYLGMSMILAACTWLPLILFGVESYINEKRSAQAYLAIFAGTFLLLSGSHPGLVTVCAAAIFAYIVIRCISERRLRSAQFMLVPFAAAILVAAPAWVPFVQNVMSVRQEYGRTHDVVNLRVLPSLFLPFVYGALYAPVFGNASIVVSQVLFAWMTPGVTFLGMAGMLAGIFRRNRNMLALAVMTGWMLLWMMDVPPFNVLRHVILVRRLTLSYLLCPIQLMVCVLAGYAVDVWQGLTKRQLAITASAWIVFMGVLVAGVGLVWRQALPRVDRVVFAGGVLPNVAWAIAVPLLFYGCFVAIKRGFEDAAIPTAFVIVAGSAIGFFPSGAAYPDVLIARIAVLIAVLVLGTWSFLQRDVTRAVWVSLGALLLLNVLLMSKYPGWPKRADPFSEPPFVRYLKQLPQSGREYALNTILFPDLSSKLGLPSINVLTMLLPPNSREFIGHYADTCQNPSLLYGVEPAGCPEPPLLQFFRHRPVWDYLGIRHVLGATAAEIQADAADSGQLYSDFIAVPVQGEVRFPVLIREEATSVEVFMSTAGRINRGPVTFVLRDSKGIPAINKQFEGAGLPIQDWIVFSPADGSTLNPGSYTAAIDYQPARPELAIVLWRDQVRPGNYLHRVRRKDTRSGVLKLAYLNPSDQITVWENQSAGPLVYVAPETTRAASDNEAQRKFVGQPDLHRTAFVQPGTQNCFNNPSFPIDKQASTLHSIAITPNRVNASLDAASAGTLVFVGSFGEGWTAKIDGQPSGTFRVNGTFLGTCLANPGRHQVAFEYRPPLWFACLAAAGAGLLLAGIGFRYRGVGA